MAGERGHHKPRPSKWDGWCTFHGRVPLGERGGTFRCRCGKPVGELYEPICALWGHEWAVVAELAAGAKLLAMAGPIMLRLFPVQKPQGTVH